MCLALALGAAIGIAMLRDMEWRSLSAAFSDFPVRYGLLSVAVFTEADAMELCLR